MVREVQQIMGFRPSDEGVSVIFQRLKIPASYKLKMPG